MTHAIASGTAHAVSHKIKNSFLKIAINPFSRVKYLFHKDTDILASNSGYTCLYSSGSGEVKVVASTKHGKEKFNIVLLNI
jgi:hypothetical protein